MTSLICEFFRSSQNGRAPSSWFHFKTPASVFRSEIFAFSVRTTLSPAISTAETTEGAFHDFSSASAIVRWPASPGWTRSLMIFWASPGFLAFAACSIATTGAFRSAVLELLRRARSETNSPYFSRVPL